MTPDLSYYWEGAREWCGDNTWDEEKKRKLSHGEADRVARYAPPFSIGRVDIRFINNCQGGCSHTMPGSGSVVLSRTFSGSHQGVCLGTTAAQEDTPAIDHNFYTHAYHIRVM